MGRMDPTRGHEFEVTVDNRYDDILIKSRNLYIETELNNNVQEVIEVILLFGGTGGGVEEAASARSACTSWAEFKELSSILTVCGASYHIKGKIYRAEHVSRAC